MQEAKARLWVEEDNRPAQVCWMRELPRTVRTEIQDLLNVGKNQSLRSGLRFCGGRLAMQPAQTKGGAGCEHHEKLPGSNPQPTTPATREFARWGHTPSLYPTLWHDPKIFHSEIIRL